MKNIILIISIALLSLSCKTQMVQTDDTETEVVEIAEVNTEIEIEYFILSEGGGFTGLYNDYKVHRSGKVEKYNNDKKVFQEYSELDKATIKKIFEKFDELELLNYGYSKPGNLNYRIQIPVNDKQHIIQWSDQNSPKIEVLEFYKNTMNIIRSM